jgi:hypothetical protein
VAEHVADQLEEPLLVLLQLAGGAALVVDDLAEWAGAFTKALAAWTSVRKSRTSPCPSVRDGSSAVMSR